MKNKNKRRIAPSDIGISVGAAMLSAMSALFAGYFIFLGPGTQIQNSVAPDIQVLASATQSESDPINTGTISNVTAARPKPRTAPVWDNQMNPTLRYKIRTENGQFFIDLIGPDLVRSIAIEAGDYVPGFGQISAIENRNGNWYLETDRGRVASEGIIPTR